MKTVTFPLLRAPQKLGQADQKIQCQFIARGLRSRDDARQSGKYASANAVIRRLEQMLLNGK